MAELTQEQCAAIVGGRQIHVALDVLAEGQWCEITRDFPLGNYSDGEGGGGVDPGISRLVQPPVIRRVLQRDAGRFATEPLTLTMRNDDGFFDRTKGVHLLNENGSGRFLRTLKRARIRIRIETVDTNTAVYHGYIDKISTNAQSATVKVQPLERLLQTVSPKEIRQGDRWYRDVDVGVLVRRVFEHAVPDLTWRADSPPTRVFKNPRPDIAPAGDLPRLGPLMDGWGRQPETVAGSQVFDSSSVPTYIVESATDDNVIYYAMYVAATRRTRLYSYSISTGNSTLFYDAEDNRPCIYMRSISATELVFAVMGIESDQLVQTRNRDCSLYSINPATSGSLTLRVQGGSFSAADGFNPVRLHDDGTRSIGTFHPTYGWEDGEMVCIGHPQTLYEYKETLDLAVGNSLSSLRTSSTVTALGGDRLDVDRVYHHSGFTHVQEAGGGLPTQQAWYHANPFGFPWVWIDRLNYYCTLRYISNAWKLRRWNYNTQTELTEAVVNFETVDDLRLRQLTGWCVVSQTNDLRLANTNWIILAVMGYRKHRQGDGGNVYFSGLYKLNLDVAPHATLGWYSGNSGLLPLVEITPADDAAGPWPTFLDCVYVRAWHSGQWPWVIGCYLDRKTKLYGLFAQSLIDGELYFGWSGSPMSGSPLVGFREIYDPSDAMATRHFVFRDCGTGALWAGQTPDTVNCSFWTLGDGRAVGDGTEAWEACPKLAYVRDIFPWSASRLFGFTAPTSPIWSWVINASTNTPQPTAVGNYQLWSLGTQMTVRVPVADFREDLVKSCEEVLSHLALLCGPRWRYGFDPSTGEAFFAESPASPVPDFRLIDPRTDGFAPSELELPAFGLERDEQTGDDVQNQILVTPWEAEVPPVSIKVELAPRDSDQFDVGIAAVTLVDSARRVTLNVVRDGLVGDLDLVALPDFDANWDSGLLLSFVEDAEDIVTELAADTSTYAALQLRGIGPAPSGYAHERMINGTLIRAALPALDWHGDFITVGESDTRRITGFGFLDIVETDGPRILDGTIRKGTSVRIQTAHGKGLYGGTDSEHGYVIALSLPGSTTLMQVANGDGVHVGDVVRIESEFVRVTKKQDTTSGQPYSHLLSVSRGYLGTEDISHPGSSGPYKCQVFLHPRRSGSYRIGATGLAISFTVDPRSAPVDRSFKSGDRVLLESLGSRATPSKFNRGIAEGHLSQSDYGKRTWKIEKNPYISPGLAPHVAYEWLQETQIARVPITLYCPLAPEILPEHAPYVVSHLRFPDESSNLIQFDLLTLEHDVRAGVTRMRLSSRDAPETEPRPSGGVGLPGGGL